MKDAERELRATLRGLSAPDEAGAEERGWRVVAAAAAQPRPALRRSRSRRRAAQVALALGLIVVVVSPAGASVRHWVADRVDPGVEQAQPVLSSLPGGGALLVQSRQGPWVVQADGSKRLLGDYAEASWSPHGLFVVATTRHQLAAVKPDGTVRWTLSRPGPVRFGRWNGPDGYRIAYLDGRSLRVVDGNGEADRALAGGVALLAPAWKSGPAHVLSFATAQGAVRTIAADTGARLFETAPGPGPLALQWVAGELLVARPGGLQLFDGAGRLRWAWAAPPGAPLRAVSAAPGTRKFAAVVRDRHGSRLLQVGPGHRPRVLFAGPGRFAAPQWSPHGGWLLLPWPSADQWLFLDTGSVGARPHAVADVAAQFAPGERRPPAFPALAGWCCPG